jgi:hypothetical protein
MNAATQQRDRVAALACSDPERAALVARQIEDPWFRCQALSYAALHMPNERFRLHLLADAFAAGAALKERNRQVTVSAWPLKVAALLGLGSQVESHTERLLRVIEQEPSPVRRADALLQVFGAVVIGDRAVAIQVIERLAAACLAPLEGGRRNKKGESLLEQALPGIARIDGVVAERIRLQLPPSRGERVRHEIQSHRGQPVEVVVPWPHIGRGDRG